MMCAVPRSAQTVAKALRTRAKALDRYLRRVERLHFAGQVPAGELKYAYTGAFITFYTETETRLEELFLGLLTGRIKPTRASIRPIVSVKSDRVARNALKGERAFVDWLPYNKTRKRARAFLSRGEPFSSLSSKHRKALERASIMRNAIAHRSGSARRLFEREFVDNKSLPPAERRPAGYLRGLHTPGQRRINLQFAEVVAALDALCVL